MTHALRAHAHAEHAFVVTMRGVLKGVHEAVEAMVIRDVLPELSTRHDAIDLEDRARRVLTPRLEKRIAGHVRSRAVEAYDIMSGQIDKKNRGAMRLIGLPVHEVAVNAGGKVAELKENAIRLVENAGRAYAVDVRDIFSNPDNDGLRVEGLTEQLYDRGRVSLSRASLIGRDQTLKLCAALTRSRFVSAGVNEYSWSGSLDERERDSHRVLEGQVFSFDAPPVTNAAGDTNNPGEDYQCRCVPIPIIQGLGEEEGYEYGAEGSEEGERGLGRALIAAIGTVAPLFLRPSKSKPAPDYEPDDDYDEPESRLGPVLQRSRVRGVPAYTTPEQLALLGRVTPAGPGGLRRA